MRVSFLQKFNDASISAFFRVSRLECFDYDKSDHSTVHCFSINIMCDKRLVHHDINSRLYWEHIKDENINIYLFQDQV